MRYLKPAPGAALGNVGMWQQRGCCPAFFYIELHCLLAKYLGFVHACRCCTLGSSLVIHFAAQSGRNHYWRHARDFAPRLLA